MHFRVMTGFALFGAALLVACSPADKNTVAKDSSVPQEAVVKTIKPGANIEMSYELRSPVSAGDTGTLDLRFTEAYLTGRVQLVASANSDGLTVYGPSSETSRDLSVPGPKDWSVLFTAEEDGLHYLNVVATIELAGQPTVSRAFSARIEVGDKEAIAAAQALEIGVETRPDGQRIKVLTAEESTGN